MIELNGNRRSPGMPGKGPVSRSQIVYFWLGWVVLIVSCLTVGLLFAGSSTVGASLSALELALLCASILVIGALGLPLVLISSIAFFYSIFHAAMERLRPLERSPAVVRSQVRDHTLPKDRF